MTMIIESQGVVRPYTSSGLFASVVGYIASYLRNRRTLQDLSAMEDHMLRDIGLSRADVMRASAAEFGADRIAMLDVACSRGIGR